MKINKGNIEIFEYKTLFPVTLFVACTRDIQIVLSYFVDAGDGSEIKDNDFNNNVALTYYNICRRSDGLNCILVIFNCLEDMDFGTIVHESVHIMQRTLQSIGEDEPGIETQAYLTEWVAKCINKSRLKLQSKIDKNNEETVDNKDK